MLSIFAIAAVCLGVMWIVLSILARPHWDASVSCQRVLGSDGVERDSWSFSGGYANTLLGQTVGRFKAWRARRKFSRQQRRREAAKARTCS